MAEDDYWPVYDMAGLLSESESNTLAEKAYSLRNAHNCDIVIITDETDITIDSEGNSNPDDVLDDYLNQLGYGKSGAYGDTAVVALYRNIYTRDWYISGYGFAEKAVNSDAISHIGDQITPYLRQDDHYTAFDTFLDQTDEMLTMYENGKPYKAPFGFFMALLISVGLGFIVAFIYVGSLKSQLKSVAAVDTAADYVVPGSMKLEQSGEFFLYRTVSRVRRQSESSGSHTGSHTGRSHSGGGGRA
jgi:uncharacterized protein